jgi:hypothetical protein
MLGIEIVEVGSLDERVDNASTVPAAIGATEQPCLASERHAAQRALGGVAGNADTPIIEQPGERIPAH